jgi:preprotein translocase subunit SecE
MSVAEQTSSGESRGIAAWWQGSRSFLTEVRNEMRRVTWPSRREVQATTLVVILVASFFGVYLWGVDLILDWVVRSIFRVFGAV